MAVGDRVELIRCSDPYTQLEPGAQGTVTFVGDFGTVHIDWDDGHRLGLVPEADCWRVIDDEEDQ
jgi:hypothetical protein